MERNPNSEERPQITINRKMRTWNRYKGIVIGAGIILLTVIIIALILKGCGGEKESKDNGETKPVTTQASIEESTVATTQAVAPTEAATETTKDSHVGMSKILAVSGNAEVQEFTSKSSFDKAVFVGDFAVSGIAGYGLLSDSQVFGNNSLASDALKNYSDEIVKAAPEKLFVMVGTNDLNYGTRTVDDIYGYISEFVTDMQKKLPKTSIYLVSILPITSRFEASSNVKLVNINALNDKLKENAASLDVSFIDVASAYKDGSGYFGTAYTDSGSNLKVGYYPFLLNGIAGVAK